jgi:hypothetical protein
MSFFPDITPLTNEVKQFNHQQQQVIALLQEIRSILLALQSKDEEQNQLLKQLIKKYDKIS